MLLLPCLKTVSKVLIQTSMIHTNSTVYSVTDVIWAVSSGSDRRCLVGRKENWRRTTTMLGTLSKQRRFVVLMFMLSS